MYLILHIKINNCSDITFIGTEGYHYPKLTTIGIPYNPSPFPHLGQSGDVKQLLDTTDEGKLIYSSYGQNKIFLRNKLSELIIKHELKKNLDKR